MRRSTIGIAFLCLAALPARAQSIQLFWDAPADGAQVSYLIESGTSSGIYTAAHPVATGTTTHAVTGLTAGTRYFFVVRAVDARGARSMPSNEISAVAPAPAPPPAPVPSGSTVDSRPAPAPPPITVVVSIASEATLRQALASPRSHVVLLLETGTYRLSRPLVVTGGVQDVTIRSRTGRAEDVTLIGPLPSTADPQPSAIIASGVTRLTLADMTIRDVAGYAVTLGHAVQQPRLQGLRIITNGSFVQSALHADGSGAASGVIEGCSFDYIGSASGLPPGIDIRGGRGWVLRGNRFMDANPRERVLFGPSIVAWQGSGGTLVERNVFIHTTREIVLGLDDRSPHQHSGGMVRNNMIVRKAMTGKRGPAISVLDSPGTVVVHNTALLSGTSAIAIDYAHPDTQGAYIVNNLADGSIASRDGASAIVESNITTATASWFVAPTESDLRLRSDTGRAAIDQGLLTPYAPTDAAGKSRPEGAGVDVGAHEYVP